MSPRKRNKENEDLPKGWRRRYGAYYYQVPKATREYWDGKIEFYLGKTLPHAHAKFAERIGYEGDVLLMEQLCDRYTLDVLPGKKPATQRSNQYSMKRIRRIFAGNRVAAVRPKHLYAYRDHIGKTESRKKANLDLEVLSHMFTKAIQWGVIDDHPMTNKKVQKFSLAHRKVMPLEDELVAFADTLPRKWQLYISLKLWTGRRKGELLPLTKFDVTDKGLRFVNNKNTDDIFILEWEPETWAIVQEIQALPGTKQATHLFPNRKNEPYIKEDGTTSGFDTMWQRYMTKAIAAGKVTRRFTEHDLRKVRASDMTPEQAQHFLRHTNAKQTRTYQVTPTVVRAIKSKK